VRGGSERLSAEQASAEQTRIDQATVVPASRIWVGGYTPEMEGTGRGIALLHRDTAGTLSYAGVAAETSSPSFLARAGDILYAAGESGPTVSAFGLSGDELTPLADVPTGGSFPCALTVVGDLLLAACYGDGALVVHPRGNAGDLRPPTQVLHSAGAGPHGAQDGPHAHGALQTDADTVLSADLGTDRVYIHRVDAAGLTRTGEVALPAGTGPRDLVLRPSGDVWVLGELSAEVLVLRRQGATFVVVARVPLAGAEPGDHASGLALRADGRALFVGLRGSNRVAVVPVGDTGELQASVTSTDCGGDWPRHLVAVGDHLYVANQRSGTVATFRIDGNAPVLQAVLAVPTPTYLLVG
jgi:6-phosphogluconolactonase